ncbi:MAG: cob(I)yrinic acid a,c-diamide adenosyltransferase [Deltaproteobacteria bacterium]|nr:cob(I)yrinic acid a,c-diamide adenosyltransferase [Deltaproteobacteria bacterium]
MASSIYTRTGDVGTTSLCDGTRVPKEATRIEAYGALDETNSWLGAARAFVDDPTLDRTLEFVEHRFYNCSSNLATPPGSGFESVSVSEADVRFLEQAIDCFEEKTGGLRGFVLPGGTRAAGMIHIARAVCRRAERRMWALARDEKVDDTVIKFVNRASDFLFAAARYANAIADDSDVLWNKNLPAPDLS